MTQDDVIRLAREAGAAVGKFSQDGPDIAFTQCLDIYKFAKLVAEHERAACIAIAESKRHSPNFTLTSMPPQNGTAVDISNAIRERSNSRGQA